MHCRDNHICDQNRASIYSGLEEHKSLEEPNNFDNGARSTNNQKVGVNKKLGVCANLLSTRVQRWPWFTASRHFAS